MTNGTVDQCLNLLGSFVDVWDTLDHDDITKICDYTLQTGLVRSHHLVNYLRSLDKHLQVRALLQGKIQRLGENPEDKALPFDLLANSIEEGIAPNSRLIEEHAIPAITTCLKKNDVAEVVAESASNMLSKIIEMHLVGDRYLLRHVC